VYNTLGGPLGSAQGATPASGPLPSGSSGGPGPGQHVLVVDDDARLRRTLALNLRARGYVAELADTGEAALRVSAAHHPDVILLDLGLPTMDGLEVIAGIRGWSSVPIIVLSAHDVEAYKVRALDLGADDYLTKPFGMDELFARIRAATRRAVIHQPDPVVTTPHFIIDLAAKRVLRDDREVHLTPRQWQIVEVLVRNQGRLVGYEQLLREVWGPSYQTETNYLRVFMTQIRKRLEPEAGKPRYFLTEPGMGYRFTIPE